VNGLENTNLVYRFQQIQGVFDPGYGSGRVDLPVVVDVRLEAEQRMVLSSKASEYGFELADFPSFARWGYADILQLSQQFLKIPGNHAAEKFHRRFLGRLCISVSTESLAFG